MGMRRQIQMRNKVDLDRKEAPIQQQLSILMEIWSKKISLINGKQYLFRKSQFFYSFLVRCGPLYKGGEYRCTLEGSFEEDLQQKWSLRSHYVLSTGLSACPWVECLPFLSFSVHSNP